MSSILISSKDWRKEKDKIEIHCPNCGIWAYLSAHTIDDDGKVNPSMWHQCADVITNEKHEDWHVFGILEGWIS